MALVICQLGKLAFTINEESQHAVNEAILVWCFVQVHSNQMASYSSNCLLFATKVTLQTITWRHLILYIYKLLYIYIYYNYKYRYIAIYIINILSYKKYIMNKEFIHNRLNFNILYKSVKICLWISSFFKINFCNVIHGVNYYRILKNLSIK